MREEIAKLVYPVLTHGLRLKERLAAGEPLEFSIAQRELQGLLQSASRANLLADFGGDVPMHENVASGRRDNRFLGIRYALVCWLDEIFILDSSWSKLWREKSLEWGLYSTNDRAFRFWEQAEWAGARPSTDSLEVFYLCIMLGFRGSVEGPDELRSRCDRIKTQINEGQPGDFALPVEGQPPTYVPVLQGAQSLQNMLVVASVALLVLIPALTFSLVLIFKR